jgi:hypothetical protein
MRMNWVQTSECMVTNEHSSKFFGSTTVQFTFVKTHPPPQVIAIRRQSIRDDALAYLFLGKGVDHFVFERMVTDRAVTV